MQPLDLGLKNPPCVFTDDEFTDFAYENGFNSIEIYGQSLGNYYQRH